MRLRIAFDTAAIAHEVVVKWSGDLPRHRFRLCGFERAAQSHGTKIVDASLGALVANGA